MYFQGDPELLAPLANAGMLGDDSRHVVTAPSSPIQQKSAPGPAVTGGGGGYVEQLSLRPPSTRQTDGTQRSTETGETELCFLKCRATESLPLIVSVLSGYVLHRIICESRRVEFRTRNVQARYHCPHPNTPRVEVQMKPVSPVSLSNARACLSIVMISEVAQMARWPP